MDTNLTGFGPETGMGGKPRLDHGWNPEQGKTQTGLELVSEKTQIKLGPDLGMGLVFPSLGIALICS